MTIFFPKKKNNFIFYLFLESDEKPSKVELCTRKIGKIRMLCAKTIWREWSNERHRGPRVGVIVISTMEEGDEKVGFFSSDCWNSHKSYVFFRFYLSHILKMMFSIMDILKENLILVKL